MYSQLHLVRNLHVYAIHHLAANENWIWVERVYSPFLSAAGFFRPFNIFFFFFFFFIVVVVCSFDSKWMKVFCRTWHLCEMCVVSFHPNPNSTYNCWRTPPPSQCHHSWRIQDINGKHLFNFTFYPLWFVSSFLTSRFAWMSTTAGVVCVTHELYAEVSLSYHMWGRLKGGRDNEIEYYTHKALVSLLSKWHKQTHKITKYFSVIASSIIPTM